MNGRSGTGLRRGQPRWGAAFAALAILASSLALVAAPAGAAPDKTAKVKEAKDLPPMPTDAAPKPKVESIKGDFSDAPPHPDQAATDKHAPKAVFDPARSKVIDAETTPTKKTCQNPDGSRTDVVTKEPTRYRDAKGTWVDIDLSPAAATDGTLRAKAQDHSATLASRADGAITLDSPQGPSSSATRARRRPPQPPARTR